MKNIWSECVFGSFARGKTDKYSDKDMLLVADDRSRVKQRENQLKDAGWSTTFYTPPHLSRLMSTGSLFALHLINEGKILRDTSNFIREAFSHYKKREITEESVSEAIDLGIPLTRNVVTDYQKACALDIGYVALRNLLIIKSAQRNEATFDFNKLVERFSNEKGLSLSEKNDLLALREAKIKYRKRDFSLPDTSVRTLEILKFSLGIFESNDGGSVPIRHLKTPYATLRDAELFLLTKHRIEDLDSANTPGFSQNIWSQITKPQVYRSTVRKIDAAWVTRLNANYQ